MANELYPSSVSWRTRLKAAGTSFIETIFPPICVNCRAAGSLLCTDCRGQLHWIDGPICNCCGQQVDQAETLCKVCQTRPLPLKQIRAAVFFEDPAATLIHKMKYEGMFGLAAPLVELMTSAWKKWQTPTDMILPIPLHPDRERKRGYNQSNLLARGVGNYLNIAVDSKIIYRNRDTSPQVGLNARDRLKNVSGAFVVHSQYATGKDVLLIDDVCTTGATMAAAAEALLDAGAASVSGYCVARAV